MSVLRSHQVAEELAPHYVGAIIGAVAAAASAAAAARQGAAQRRSARNSAALSSMPQGGGSQFTPTALSEQAKGGQNDLNSLGLKDLMSGDNKQEFNLFKGNELAPSQFSPAGQAPAPGATDKDFHLFGGGEMQANLAAQSMGQPPPVTSQPVQPGAPAQQGQQGDAGAGGGGMGSADYINLASTAGQLAAQFALSGRGGAGQGGGIPQPGNMNFQPTALAQLARRRY